MEIEQKYRLKIPTFPPKQHQAFISEGRFIKIAGGRRSLKTTVALTWIMCRALEKNKQICLWVANELLNSRRIFRLILRFYKQLVKDSNKSELYIELINDTIIWFKTAESPESLIGEGYHYVIVDEAGSIKDQVWEDYIYASLMDKAGRAILLGSSRGKNWFYRQFMMGVEDKSSFLFTTYDNPYIKREIIEEAKQKLSQMSYEQEIMGVFLDNASAVFKNISNLVKPKPINDISYVISSDFHRFNKLDWGTQKKLIYDICSKYSDSQIYADATGLGDPLCQDLERMGLRIQPFVYTQLSKDGLMQNLLIQTEQEKINIIDDVKIKPLIDELGFFEYSLTKTGKVTYSAPEKLHDDCVNSFALASLCLQNSNYQYAIGIDFARKTDYTVITIIDRNNVSDRGASGSFVKRKDSNNYGMKN